MLFANLPEDVLWYILATNFDRDSHTLAVLALLSKRFNRITTPILYAHVTLGLDEADESRKVRRFIMSVFSSPYLAQCVRSLELNQLSWSSHQSLSRRRVELVERMKTGNVLGRPDRLDMFKLVTVVRRLPLLDTHKRKWCTELQEVAPSLDSLIALAFVFLPSLEKLESNWSQDPAFIWHMLPQTDTKKVEPSPTPLVLKSLTHLKINSESPCGDSSEILPFLHMPSLTHFFASNWGPIKRDGLEAGGDLQAVSPASSASSLSLDSGRGLTVSPIAHLELRHCHFDLFSLRTIVRRCRSVRTFIFHRDWDPRVSVRLSGKSIIHALYPLMDTLENIALSFEPGLYLHQEGEISPLDFSHFPVLTSIHVAAGYLVHNPDDFDSSESSDYRDSQDRRRAVDIPLYDRLPESLEVLRITGFSTLAQAQFLIDDCYRVLQHRDRFPRLRELSIEAPFDDPNTAFDTKALHREARRADVLLRKIDNTDTFDDDYDLFTDAGYNWGMNGEFRWGTKLF
ncbi:hypothetical protein BJY04DRAFT_44402 [Aspergillus karnatakaensis]|uniref:uncharacterized protein n=1 Tax=Aspergillus karnatakaensis TaxID=1810916 RepID=UPI003CCD7DFA